MTAKKYYVYILTNYTKTVLYTGVTNNLEQRLIEHFTHANKHAFTSKNPCFYLLFYESHSYVNNAIVLEKEIKGWRRSKKEDLIRAFNPEWKFLNSELLGSWPPKETASRL